MKFTGILSAALVICFCTANLYAGIYSWTDENGVKHYSNVAPPQQSEEIEEIQGNKSNATPITKQSRQMKKPSRKPENDSTNKGMSLRMAVNSGRLEEVERLLSEGADINDRASNGMTPLILASWMGHTKVVELLLRKGADVNAKSNIGSTALKLATERGHKKIIALLQKYGA